MTNARRFTRVATAYDLPRMKRSRIIAGGIGGARGSVEDLARCGIGEFVIIDHDIVEEPNIATQQVYQEEIGRAKVDCIADRILQINPDAEVEVYQQSLLDIDDAEFARLAFSPMRQGITHGAGGDPPEITLLCGFTDNFYAQARVNRLALQYALPSL